MRIVQREYGVYIPKGPIVRRRISGELVVFCKILKQ